MAKKKTDKLYKLSLKGEHIFVLFALNGINLLVKPRMLDLPK